MATGGGAGPAAAEVPVLLSTGEQLVTALLALRSRYERERAGGNALIHSLTIFIH
jgi:hypothetical protein